MNIKCIALDLDRTTLNASGRLSDGNYNALCHAIENGVHIVIASGRSFDTLPKDVLAVPGIEYAITSNGAATVSYTHLDVYKRQVLHDVPHFSGLHTHVPQMFRILLEAVRLLRILHRSSCLFPPRFLLKSSSS